MNIAFLRINTFKINLTQCVESRRGLICGILFLMKLSRVNNRSPQHSSVDFVADKGIETNKVNLVWNLSMQHIFVNLKSFSLSS